VLDEADARPESMLSRYRTVGSGRCGGLLQGSARWRFEGRLPADPPGGYLVAKLRGRDGAAVGSQRDEAAATPV
jgi:hypothetical protein